MLPADGNGFCNLLQRPRLLRLEHLTGQIHRIRTIFTGRPYRSQVRNLHGQGSVGRILRPDRLLRLQDIILEARLLHSTAEETRLPAAVKADGPFIRLPQGKGSGKVTGPVLVQFLPAFLIHRIAHRVCNIGINCLSVGSHDAAHKIRRAHAPLNLEGKYPCLNQLRDIPVHAHVLQGQLVVLLVILIKNLPRRLVNQLVLPAARLQAASPVAALAEQHPGVDALAAFSNAHIAMHEILDFQPGALLEQSQLRKSHLPAHYDAGNAVLLQLLDGMLVMGIHHDGCMQGNIHTQLPGQLQNRKILHQNRIRPDLVEICQVTLERLHFLHADEVVQGNVQLHAMGMGILNGLLQHLIIEIGLLVPVHAHVKMLATQINSVSTCFHCCYQCIPVAGRCQQLNGFTV